MPIIVQIDAYDPVTAGPVTLRMASDDDTAVCHLNGQVWWPVLDRLPVLAMDFFGGEFGQVTTAAASLSLAVEPWPDFARYAFPDARLQIWHGDTGAAWAGYTLRFDGRVTSQPVIEDGRAQIGFAVDDKWLDTPMLATYAGTGGAEGPAAMKGTVKPIAIGAPLGVPGVMLDPIKSILQLSAYGAIESVDVPLERLARQFGSPIADYATYAALDAAAVPAGQWATAKAVGLVKMGAPPYGKLCFLMKGDKGGVDGWVRRPGAIIKRFAGLAGGAAKVSETAVDALDTARPYDLSVYYDRQITAREAVQAIAASVNAVAGVSLTGQLIAVPIQINATGVTLRADGSSLPIVGSVRALGISAPWWRLAIGAQPFFDVHGQGEYIGDPPVTTIYPEPAPSNLPEGHLHIDGTGRKYRFSGLQLLFGGAALLFNGQPIFTSGYVDAQDQATVQALADAAAAANAATIAQGLANDAQATADGKVQTFYQASAPTAEGVGDLWFDTDDGNKQYRWSGSAWVLAQDAGIGQAITDAAGAQATADGKVTTFYVESTPTAEALGDLWFKPSTGFLSRWDGSAWVEVANIGATPAQISAIADALTDAANAQATADGKIDSFYQTTAPSSASEGDLWIDTDDGNKLYRRTSGVWVAVQDSAIGTAISAAAGAQATADGKVTTFYVESTPTAEALGDLWFKPSTGYLTRWNGSAWVDVANIGATAAQVASIIDALNDAANAQATADGKIDSFYQTTAPGTASEGDLWIDTDDGNKLYRRNSGVWVVVQDSAIGTAISAAAGAQATADGKVTTFYVESTPTAEGIGDLWHQPSTQYLRRWNGSAWVIVSNVGARTAQFPTAPPTDWDVGSIYIDGTGKKYRFSGKPLLFGGSPLTFGGDPIYTSGYTDAQDRAVLFAIEEAQAAQAAADLAQAAADAANAAIAQIDDDDIITISEKVEVLIPGAAAFEALYTAVSANAAAAAVSVTTLNTRRTAWLSALAAISPAWNNITAASPVARGSLDTARGQYDSELKNVQQLAIEAMTAAKQVVIVPPVPQTVFRDWLGAVKDSQYPRTLTPKVERGGVDIRTSNDVNYSITTTGTITATVNNTTASADKGRISATGGSSGSILLTITVSGVAQPVFTIPFTNQDDNPPTTGGGGGSANTGGSDSTLEDVASTSFAAITQRDGGESVFLIDITSGQTINGTAPLTYTKTGTNATATAMVAKWQYRLQGDPTWLDFTGSSVTGTGAFWNSGDFAAEQGEITANQSKSGLATGTYECRLVAAKDNSAAGNLQVVSGAATVSKS